MRRSVLLGILGVLAASLFASTCPLSLAQPQWVTWDVYLYFPEPEGEPWPYYMESDLPWWDGQENWDGYITGSENLYVREVFPDGRYFFFRGVKDYVDIQGEGGEVDGTYILQMLIAWEWPMGLASIAGGFVLHSGTGYFRGMTARGSAEVEIVTDPNSVPTPPGPSYGPLMVQHQEGHIFNCPN